MSKKYNFDDNDKLYFVSFAVTNWIDLFIRNEYRESIETNNTESRREWIIWMMERAAKKNANTAKFQLWQPESHPIQLMNNKMAHQKLDYT